MLNVLFQRKFRNFSLFAGIRDDQPSQRVNAVATTSCQVERKVEVAPTVDRNRGKRMPSKLMRYLLSPRSSSSASRRASSSELNESVADVIGDSNDRWVQVKPNIFQSVAICTFHTPWQFYLQVLSPEYVYHSFIKSNPF